MLRTSLITHVFIVAAIVLVPAYWSSALPDPIVVNLVYDPPPPPPPPLPKGRGLVDKAKKPEQVTHQDKPKVQPEFVAHLELPQEMELVPEDLPEDWDIAGSPEGHDLGMEGGMALGIPGGVLGGVPGGVLGGVVGGTGDGPVMDYDHPPRLIKSAQPIYPQEAFVKKVEGVVVIEIWIDVHGNVIRPRVKQSIPLLDAAAIACVKKWQFEPARKGGKPVATIATAPVTFRIY
jgi:protein TonB